MNFITVEDVRTFSGLDDEDNIPSNLVRDKIDMAGSMFIGAVSDKYVFPMKYHRSRKITIAGPASATGNYGITVNGTEYLVAVTSGAEATDIADLLRDDMKGNDDFITDNIGSGPIIILTSVTDSDDLTTADAEINASETTALAGVSSTIGVRFDRYPPVVRLTVAELASALLLGDSYGDEAEDTQKSPSARMDTADEILSRIQGTGEDDKFIKILDEITNEELENSVGEDTDSLPNDTTNIDTDDPTAAKSGINDKW